MRINDLLNETIPAPGVTQPPAGAAQPTGMPPAGAAQTGISPQQQLAMHQKEVQDKKKTLQIQITQLNTQIMDLKKQLAAVK